MVELLEHIWQCHESRGAATKPCHEKSKNSMRKKMGSCQLTGVQGCQKDHKFASSDS